MLYVVLIALIIFLSILLALKSKQRETKECSTSFKDQYPYKKRDFFFTVAEKSFFEVLQPIIKEHNYVIFPKARLANIIIVEKGTINQTSYWNKIKSKHIDFLICDGKYFNPKLAIELDDSSHNQQKRITRDIFVDHAFKSAGLPFLRFRPKHNPEEVKEYIEKIISPSVIINQ